MSINSEGIRRNRIVNSNLAESSIISMLLSSPRHDNILDTLASFAYYRTRDEYKALYREAELERREWRAEARKLLLVLLAVCDVEYGTFGRWRRCFIDKEDIERVGNLEQAGDIRETLVELLENRDLLR
ncbi:hypothetical protein TWF281_004818 [Arthrobotrys megalospora]